MTTDTDNYFSIVNPENWFCTIWSYQVSHGLPGIKAVNSENIESPDVCDLRASNATTKAPFLHRELATGDGERAGG